METRLTGQSREVIIGPARPTVLIGEKINPTGRPDLARALKSGDLEPLLREAREQVRAGADILDINVGLPEVDEGQLLPRVVSLVADAVEVPLCLDSSNPEALAAGLAASPGRVLINSVTGEAASLAGVLPLAGEHKAALIGLTIDDRGIPAGPEARLAVAEKIAEEAVKSGLAEEDLIIDCLAMSVGADQQAGLVTLKAIELVRDRLGLNQTLGGSNISFGLPGRELLDAAFLTLALAAGVTCPIVDASRVGAAVRAADLVLGRDPFARRFTADFRKKRR